MQKFERLNNLLFVEEAKLCNEKMLFEINVYILRMRNVTFIESQFPSQCIAFTYLPVKVKGK